MDFCEHPEIAFDKRKKIKFVLNGNPTVVSSQIIAGIPRLNELIELSGKALNIKNNHKDEGSIRIFRSEGVELFEEDLKYLKQNEILYVSTNNEDFDDSNNFAMYKILQKVGKGGYGSVYEAKHRITKERIAIKMINGSSIRSAKDIEMMFKEIGLLKNLNHKNIIKVVNCYTLKSEMKLAIVLEYLEGGDLREYLEKQPGQKIDEESARKIFLQLFSAIQYCHREKIIHRDLKLENIMFSNKNYDTIKVVDFGISAQQSLINIDYTQAGSARYFAPEVLSTKAPAHPSIDIWAMGCILFWMIIGQSPFSQNTKEEVFNNILKGNYSIPSEAKPKITKSVQDLIHKMLQVDVESRITMTEMAQHQWLKNSVEEIKEIERIEREEHLKLLRIQKSSQNQRRSFNNQFNSASKIQIGVSNLLNNTQSINKVDIVRRKEGFKTIMNTPSASFFNQLNLRKNSLNLQEQDKQKAEDITPKFDATKYQLIIASYQKKHLQQKKLPQIKEQQQINSNQKKIQSQRTLKVCKDRPQNFSQIESPLPNNNYGINSPGLLGQIGGLMTPKQMNTPTPLRNQFAPNIQSSNNYKTPKQKQGEIYVNENNYSVNKTYNSQVNLQNKQLFVNNTNNQQNEYLLKVNNNFSNIINSQMKIMNDKITPLQTPSSTKNKQPIMQQFKDLNPNLLRKNDSKFTQQKLIQITNNTPPIQSFTELDSIQNNKFSFLNTSNNNLQPLKNRNSHLFIDASQQFALCQQNLEQESQIIKIQPSKRIYTHN